jgi:hypothetical protein
VNRRIGMMNMNNEDYILLLEKEKEKEEYKKFNPIQEFLESCGIKVWREVIPDECKYWEHPYRVDMIFEIPNYGLVGVEGKNLNTHGQGSLYANAYIQIRDKYKDKKYFNGKKVRRWCVLGLNDSDMGGERVVVFIKHFMNKLGISYLEYRDFKYKNKGIFIDSLTQHRLFITKSGVEGIDDKYNYLMDYGINIK